MEYSNPPAPAPQLCIRQVSDSVVPGRHFIAFNEDPARAYDTEAYEYLSVIVPKCELNWLNLPAN